MPADPQPSVPEPTLSRPDDLPSPHAVTKGPSTGDPPREGTLHTGGAVTFRQPGELKPDFRLPGYEMLGELGHGGMGVVYKARQLQANRLVALKMIKASQHASDEERIRFKIEAEAAARLTHPHIVQLHEVGEHNGLPYFSLEFCSGGSLDRKLKDWKPTAKEAADLVETLARAMTCAASSTAT
jgi:serine/threonine protein kinase